MKAPTDSYVARNTVPGKIDHHDNIAGLDPQGASWGDHPLDDLLIRQETHTVYAVIRHIDRKRYILNPEFQRDFIWRIDKQSKLIESVILRIPLPVIYLAEDDLGRMVVVDGLQRLSTFQRFLRDQFRLDLPDRSELHGKRFSELFPKFQNRIEGCNLIFYTLDWKVPERARLDIFERVNGGVPLTRQQMRNCLFMGPATRFLKEESRSDIFLEATGRSLNQGTMRDREFVNRFCAFQLLGVDEYDSDMDDFLARCLKRMNAMPPDGLAGLSADFRQGLTNNLFLFGCHAFRKSRHDSKDRSVMNASFWDVMSTSLSRHCAQRVSAQADAIRNSIHRLLDDDEFTAAITHGTNDARQVRARFRMVGQALREVLGHRTD